jgi:hypothetical protein
VQLSDLGFEHADEVFLCPQKFVLLGDGALRFLLLG